MAEAEVPDGAINFRTQIERTVPLVAADIQQALVRLEAASVGLVEVFGYATAIPGTYDLDALCLWARNATGWLRLIRASDATTTVTVSLKSVLGDKWKNFLKDQRTKFILTFPSNKANGVVLEQLKGSHLVRINSLCAYVLNSVSGESNSWTVRIAPPPVSEVILADGSFRPLNIQNGIGVAIFGRVGDRDANRAPEALLDQVENASPFGEWEVQIDAKSAEGRQLVDGDTESLADVGLEIGLSYRRSK